MLDVKHKGQGIGNVGGYSKSMTYTTSGEESRSLEEQLT